MQPFSRRALVRSLPFLPPALGCGRLALPEAAAEKGGDTGFHVGPFLSAATPDAITVTFETDGAPADGRVDFGPTPALGRTAAAFRAKRLAGAPVGRMVYHVRLGDLQPGTRYFYRARGAAAEGFLHSFRTPPAPGAAAPFRFAVYSDCQQHPGVHAHVVTEALLAGPAGRGVALEDDLAFVLVAGDIVQNGDAYWQYRDRFFGPARDAACRVPYYAVIGNHEGDSQHFWDYLVMPRYYSFDHGNVHVIGLDTNDGQKTAEQLVWLERDLAAAAADERIDLIFAFFHHPFKSELWPAGDEPYSGEIVRRLEAALAASGKAGAYFFGHTHGYSRGQSKDAPLYWVNVGSAGGSLDRFGDYENQTMHPEYQRTFSDYGALIVEVNPDGAPGFTATRLSYGDDDEARRPGWATDVFGATRDPKAPSTPRILARTDQTIVASAYEGDAPHLETEWALGPTADLATGATSRWLRREKIYDGRDVMAGVALDRLPLAGLAEGPAIRYARVRYRDERLAWSAWSEPHIIAPV